MFIKKIISLLFVIQFFLFFVVSPLYSQISIPTPLGSTQVWQALKKDLNGSGKWNQISFADGTNQATAGIAGPSNLAEMILHDNSIEMVIDSNDKQHALRLFLAGDLEEWTFDAGSTGAITNTADNGGTLRITDVGHGLVTGNIVTITGLSTAAQNDVTVITRIDDDTFDCADITFVTGSETGTWNRGSSLIAGVLSTGKCLVQLGISAISAAITPEITYHIYINTTQQQGDAIQFDLKTSAGRGFMSQIVTIAANDIVWVSVLETSNNINITNIFSNLNLHKL